LATGRTRQVGQRRVPAARVQTALGHALAGGWAGQREPTRAALLFRQAADKGDPLASAALTELATATDHPYNGSGDPEVRDLFLLDGDDVYVHIDAQTRGADSEANWWALSIYISDQKVWN